MAVLRRAGAVAAVSPLLFAVLVPGTPAFAAPAASEITVAACPSGPVLVPGELDEGCGGDAAGAMFTGLVEYVPGTAATRNAVASSITTADNTLFTVRLRKGWRFHDGTEVRAANFVNAWNRAARTGLDAAYYFSRVAGFSRLSPTRGLSGLKVIDDQTFTITLNEPYGGLVPLLGRLAFAPLPDSYFTSPAAYRARPVGNGPYRFAARSADKITLRRNEDYGGAVRPSVRTIVYRGFSTWDTAYRALLRGEVDFAPGLPRTTGLGGRVLTTPSPGVHVLNFPMRQPRIAGNAHFRRALSMAIPRERVLGEFGLTRTPADSFAPPLTPGGAGMCGAACAYDPAGARAALAQARAAGFTPPLVFPLYYNADATHVAWAKLLAASVTKALNGEVKVVARPVATFTDLLRQADGGSLTGMYRWAWLLDSPHPADVLATYRTGAADNHSGYSDRRYDALLAAADRARPAAGAASLYRRAEGLLARDMPAIPLAFYRNVAGYSEKVSHVRTTLFGGLDVFSVRSSPRLWRAATASRPALTRRIPALPRP